MKWLIVSLLLISSHPALPFECEGENITWAKASSSNMGGEIALSFIDKFGRKFVTYDDVEISKYPPILRKHIFAHECSHHKLKHTKRPRGYVSSQLEADADCLAVRLLNWSRKEVSELIVVWKTTGMPENILSIREKNILSCLDK